jgi:heat shock protein HslJ
MMVARIFGAVCALLAVFLFGMWLAWPELPYNPSGFPIDRKFVAVSLNGEPLLRRDAPTIPTLEVRGRLTFRHRVGGTSFCNHWGGHVTFLPARRIAWGAVVKTLAACVPNPEMEERYLQTLLSAARWRTQDGVLILDNGTDILRFRLAPP